MFQFLSPKMERPPDCFPMTPDRRTAEHTSELSSSPEEMIHYPYITSDQAAPYRIWNLHAIREVGLLHTGFLFSWTAPSINKIANKIASISLLQFALSRVRLCQDWGDGLILFCNIFGKSVNGWVFLDPRNTYQG